MFIRYVELKLWSYVVHGAAFVILRTLSLRNFDGYLMPWDPVPSPVLLDFKMLGKKISFLLCFVFGVMYGPLFC